MNKVLVASSIGPGKEYAIPILENTLNNVTVGLEEYIVADEVSVEYSDYNMRPVEEKLTRIQRIARVREKTRQHFLKGDWTHLFFLDADILPPAWAVEKLLAHKAPIATGLYPLRDFSSIELPAVVEGLSGKTVYGPKYFESKVDAFGMGCMLIERSVLKKTKFRQGDALNSTGEDYGFCMDAGVKVVLDHTVNCWHVHSNMIAGRFDLQDVTAGVVWEGSARYAINKYGKWERGKPKYHLKADQIAKLGPEFKVGQFTPVKVETRKYADITQEA